MKEIAERTHLPQPYLEQILLSVKGAGLVRSKRGVGGGYVLARAPGEITLADIVAAVEGPQIVLAEHPDHCEGHCILQEVWVGVDDESRRILERVTLAELVDRTRVGHPDAAPEVTRSTARGRRRLPAASSARRSSTASSSAGERLVEPQAFARGRVVEPERARVQERPRAAGSDRASRRRCRRRRRDARSRQRCTRIWCVRPVSSVHSRRLQTGSANASITWYSVRAALPSSRTAIRVRRSARAADRRVDHPPRRRQPAPHERRVHALDRSGRELPDQRVVRARAERATIKQSARVAVEAVHDARTDRVADRFDAGETREQPVDQRSARMPRAGMHDEPGGLRDDDDIVVGEAHVDHDAGIGIGPDLGFERGFGEHLEHASLVQAVTLGHDSAVDHHRAAFDELLHRGPGPAGEERERTIDAIAFERGGDRDRPVDHGVDSGYRASAAGANSVRTINTIAPTVTHESAKLNTGHQPTAMKSTT